MASNTVTDTGSLQTKVYNPQTNAIFPVTSTLVSGETEVILFDAQFSITDGQKLVELLKESKKNLTLIIISCGDPDFYFGLEPIKKAFPNAMVVACAEVVDHISTSKDYKLEYWSPQLKDGAPKELFVPETATQTTFTIDDQSIELRSRESYAAFYWIPKEKIILGGVGVTWGIHVFTADTQTKERREAWRKTLKEMIELGPEVVIPGHYLGDVPSGSESIKFTLNYLEDFEEVLEQNNYKNSAAVIEAMKVKYPDLKMENLLELCAKVNTGEMKF